MTSPDPPPGAASPLRDRRRVALAGLALLGVVVLYGTALRFTFTSHYRGANDFMIPWYGARALLLEGKDPYSAEVSAEIQDAIFQAPRGPDQHQYDFAYPLTVIPFLAPYTLLPYSWAQPLWHATLHVLIVMAVILWLRTAGGGIPKPAALGGVLLWTLTFYPVARAFILGQIAVLVFGALAVGLWAFRRGHDRASGTALAIATVKPQLSFLLVPVLIFLAWRNGRRRLVSAFALVLSALVAVGLILQPDWPVSFVVRLQEYSQYTNLGGPHDSPNVLEFALRFAHVPFAVGVAALLKVALVTWVLAWTWRARDGADWIRLSCATLLISAVVVPRTATTDQILLLFPWFWLLLGLPLLVRGLFAAMIWGALWWFFLATVQGNHEAMALRLGFPAAIVVGWLAVIWLERSSVRERGY